MTAPHPLKLLHTSDWHLGRSLYGRKRYEEFEAFLEWLITTIEQEQIDVLVIAGDIFDNGTPSNRAQQLYYEFLCRAATSCCRHVVVTAGNHDSPSFLAAPKELLRALQVHIIGAITDDPADEVLVLNEENGRPLAIVCAVPYLRDKDIRTVTPGESLEDKNQKMVNGVQQHYADVCAVAEKVQVEFQQAGFANVPIIAMGHLFTAGGQTMDGDGVRELYVGSLAHVGAEVFPACIDYLALGHLHIPQSVGKMEHIRYSGSPLPMGFGEAKQQKCVVFVEFNQQAATNRCICTRPVPCFQPLEQIKGSLDVIRERIEQLALNRSTAWLEVEYIGADRIGNLREQIEEAIADTSMEIRRIKNKQVTDRVLSAMKQNETLDDLNVHEVFQRCLDAFEVPLNTRPVLIDAYAEVVRAVQEEDSHAE